jgi:hypothetical protein
MQSLYGRAPPNEEGFNFFLRRTRSFLLSFLSTCDNKKTYTVVTGSLGILFFLGGYLVHTVVTDLWVSFVDTVVTGSFGYHS